MDITVFFQTRMTWIELSAEPVDTPHKIYYMEHASGSGPSKETRFRAAHRNRSGFSFGAINTVPTKTVAREPDKITKSNTERGRYCKQCTTNTPLTFPTATQIHYTTKNKVGRHIERKDLQKNSSSPSYPRVHLLSSGMARLGARCGLGQVRRVPFSLIFPVLSSLYFRFKAFPPCCLPFTSPFFFPPSPVILRMGPCAKAFFRATSPALRKSGRGTRAPHEHGTRQAAEKNRKE